MRLHRHVDHAQRVTKYATMQLQRQQGDHLEKPLPLLEKPHQMLEDTF
jgi:hypothetical protein